ncbi:hypothetical protein BU14_0072s0016 [Porphyra umbilicalis]|uniref:Asparaginase n=1 Tax=Porphyra umbilicalis TaxID=2786 RepID=A0A1X6PFP2_PORUM|nr:hypothetical protein BU14_0072s0016 [Porphyra umbilicalis]|eukprot:OSX79658.1 hypothetical protein BU14_0072s0016 [Porphyra umbilicalis]
MPVALAIHGGAGAIPRTTPPGEYTPPLHASLDAGMAVLAADTPRPWEARSGLSVALSAAMAAVEVLEGCPLFNASVGSVLTTAGTVELEASVMDGRDGRAGAVAGVTAVTNPTRLAALVLSATPHAFLGGEGAAALAAAHAHELSWALLGAATAVSVVRAMEYGGLTAAAAADRVLGGMAPGSAGLIAVTPGGEVVMAKNTGGMYCGCVDGGGRRRLRIWEEDL